MADSVWLTTPTAGGGVRGQGRRRRGAANWRQPRPPAPESARRARSLGRAKAAIAATIRRTAGGRSDPAGPRRGHAFRLPKIVRPRTSSNGPIRRAWAMGSRSPASSRLRMVQRLRPTVDASTCVPPLRPSPLRPSPPRSLPPLDSPSFVLEGPRIGSPASSRLCRDRSRRRRRRVC